MCSRLQYMFFIKSHAMHLALLAGLLSLMSVVGWRNVTDQRNIIGEYSNPALEDLINWIQRETPRDAAFAGPMPIMASILLTTGRPVVNHPHYEDTHLRYHSNGTSSSIDKELMNLNLSPQ